MFALIRKEMQDGLRNRWLQAYALLLASLGLIAAWAASHGAGGLGLQMFGRTAATLTNFCILLSPLVALTLGASSIAGERDRATLNYLLAQPLDRREVLLAKFLGLLVSLALATAAGFAPAALLVGFTAGPSGLARFLVFPLLALLLQGSMLGLGILISVLSRSGAQAQARSIFSWFLFVLLYDLLLMGTLVTAGVGTASLVALLLLNPVDSARILAVLALEPDLYLLGPAGAFLLGTISRGGTAFLLIASLLLWTVLPLGLALFVFRTKAEKATTSAGSPGSIGRFGETRTELAS